jgi:hypothetical protein
LSDSFPEGEFAPYYVLEIGSGIPWFFLVLS